MAYAVNTGAITMYVHFVLTFDPTCSLVGHKDMLYWRGIHGEYLKKFGVFDRIIISHDYDGQFVFQKDSLLFAGL